MIGDHMSHNLLHNFIYLVNAIMKNKVYLHRICQKGFTHDDILCSFSLTFCAYIIFKYAAHVLGHFCIIQSFQFETEWNLPTSCVNKSVLKFPYDWTTYRLINT